MKRIALATRGNGHCHINCRAGGGPFQRHLQCGFFVECVAAEPTGGIGTGQRVTDRGDDRRPGGKAKTAEGAPMPLGVREWRRSAAAGLLGYPGVSRAGALLLRSSALRRESGVDDGP
jgi:hypothetical protein